MGKYDSGRATDLGGINIEARRPDSLNGIRFDSDRTDVPSSANDVILFRYGSALHFWDGSSDTTLGSAGGLVNFSLNDAYDDGRAITCDAGAVTINGVNMDTATLALNADAGSSGPIVLFTNSGSGNDITGTSATWGITAAGAATFASVIAESVTAAANLTLEATGAGTISIGATSTGAIDIGTGGGVVTIASASLTITGGADADAFIITAGDTLISDGHITMVQPDNETSIGITSAGVTTGYSMVITSNAITSGGNYKSVTSAAGFIGTHFLADEDGSTVFSVGLYGAVTIAGTATGTDSLTLTTGDFKQSDGAAFITNSADAAALTIVADANTTNIVIDVNADGVTSGTLLHLDTSSAGFTGKYIQCYDGAADDFSVGTDGATTITTSAAGTIGLTIAHAGTTGDAMQITATALTTGDALQIASTAETLAAGELLKITNTENGNISATPKTGNLVSITSSVTSTTASASLDYDAMLISRSNIANEAGQTLTAAGSVLKLLLTSTNTAGTCTDTTVGLEIQTVDGGTAAPTGDVVKITSVGVGAKAINVISASTTASDVLITGSGVKANTKGVLEVTGSGATAAGGAILRVAATGTPAAATSYLAVFTNAAATVSGNNPVCVYVNGKDSTAAALQVTGSGAMAGGLVELNSTATGALGAVLKLDQTANSAANSDVIGRILFTAQDNANAAESYARIDAKITDVTAANPDADLLFYVDRAGTLTLELQLDSDINGIVIGDGAAAGIVQSSGNFDLTMQTGNATSGTITITDGANGAITVTPNGSGKIDLANAVLMSKTESIGAGVGGAIDVVSSISELATDAGGDAYQLADGTEGQVKFIVLKTDGGGDAVITPANPGGYATITMADAGDCCYLLFTNGKWYIAGQYGCTVA